MKLKYFLSFILMLSTHFLMAQNTRPEVGRYCKTYAGVEHTLVTIVRYGADTNDEILVTVEGIDHSWDKKIFKGKGRITNANTGAKEYQIQLAGKNWNLLVWENEGYTLYLPKENIIEASKQRLKFVTNESYYTPERLLTAYLEQNK